MQAYFNANPGAAAMLALIAAAVILAAVIVILCVQSARTRRERERLFELMRRESEQRERGASRISRAVGDSVRQVAEMSGAMDARLDALEKQVGEKLDARLSESFRLVNGQLADVHRGLGEMRDLAANVTDLKKVLGNVKTRGVWGEVLLKNVLEEMFAPDQYEANAAIPEGGAQRVEFALRLPDRERETTLLPIDSKFPQEDYIRLTDAQRAGDAAQAERCLKMLERALIEQAKTISEKYIRPPQTVDFAVMFLPAEGLYAEAARLPGLIERVQTKYRVLIAGPGTLCALLTSLQMGFRTSALEKRSGEILELFDELRGEFAKFQEGIARARSRMDQAEAELDAMEIRARKIGKKLL